MKENQKCLINSAAYVFSLYAVLENSSSTVQMYRKKSNKFIENTGMKLHIRWFVNLLKLAICVRAVHL